MSKEIKEKNSVMIRVRVPIAMRNQLQKKEIETQQDLSKVLRDCINKGLK